MTLPTAFHSVRRGPVLAALLLVAARQILDRLIDQQFARQKADEIKLALGPRVQHQIEVVGKFTAAPAVPASAASR